MLHSMYAKKVYESDKPLNYSEEKSSVLETLNKYLCMYELTKIDEPGIEGRTVKQVLYNNHYYISIEFNLAAVYEHSWQLDGARDELEKLGYETIHQSEDEFRESTKLYKYVTYSTV